MGCNLDPGIKVKLVFCVFWLDCKLSVYLVRTGALSKTNDL